jgi:hypothetical protein
MNIVVSGMIAADPHQGGAAWAVLQYVLGLAELGHRVWLVEPIKPEALRAPGTAFEQSINAAYFRDVASGFGLDGNAALLLAGTEQTVGLPYAELRDVARGADLLINISGMLVDPALLEPIARRVYLDLDPAFVQLWHAVQGVDMRFAAHTHFVTVGQAIGQPGCEVPTCGLRWIPTFQPVVLSRWRAAGRPTQDALTTVANWRGYGSIEHHGVHYGQKCHSLRALVTLPTLTSETFLLALDIDPGESHDLPRLAAHGWRLVDPGEAAGTPSRYQCFIQSSKAEFGIAISGYVAAQCGWFSDRSACYLASGRPVLAQDTAFGRFLPTGDGLFAFRTHDDVLAAIEALRGGYARHARAARALAEEFFDSRRVLPRLLEQVGAAA